MHVGVCAVGCECVVPTACMRKVPATSVVSMKLLLVQPLQKWLSVMCSCAFAVSCSHQHAPIAALQAREAVPTAPIQDLQCTIAFLSQSAGTLSVRDELFEGWSLYGRPPSALVASLRGWGQLQRSCLRAPL